MKRSLYGARFYDSIGEWARSSAAVVIPMLLDWLPVASALDVGCGPGFWMAELQRSGVADLRGVDQEKLPDEVLAVDPSLVERVDLSSGFSLGRRFDLVLSLEVAEHLPSRCAPEFVRSLAAHGDLLLFLAAIPHQGGHGHLNEQWPSYWIELFCKEGFTCLDPLRPVLWTDRRVAPFYRQNLLVLARGNSLALLDSARGSWHPSVPDLVHPEIWHAKVGLPGNVVRAAAKAFVPAVKSKAVRMLRGS